MDNFEHDNQHGEEFETFHPVEAPKPSFWRKLGGGSLSISVMIHAILLGAAVVWIYQVIPPAEDPPVDFMPSGGGGGSKGSEVSQHKRANMMAMNAPRVVASGAASGFVLPEQDMSSTMTSVGELSSGGLSGGLGGSGSGGGRGDGHGTGFGPGMGIALGGTASGLINPFGMVDPNADALIGVFYDLKQDEKGKDNEMTTEKYLKALSNFTGRGWNERLLDKFYQASQKLYQTRIYMPLISSDQAPKAFNAAGVKGSLWVAVYRGNVVAPKSGKFRFVGAADDVIAVRFAKKDVFEHGYYHVTTGHRVDADALAGKSDDKVKEKQMKDSAMRLPVTFYKYQSTQAFNGVGGLAVGPEFEVREGVTYPIEIMIGEVPGGLFGAVLMIQESGVTYEKDSNGSPILPIFRTNNLVPEKQAKDNAPPFDTGGPIWKVTKSAVQEI